MALLRQALAGSAPRPPSARGPSPEGANELSLPADEQVGDGEWVLVIFEIGERRRATAAAARGAPRKAGVAVVAFEPRDWGRLCAFAEPRPSRTDGMSQASSGLYPRHDESAAEGAPTERTPSRPPAYDDTMRGRLPEPPGSGRSSPPPSIRPDSGAVSLSASGGHVAATGARVLLVDDDDAIGEVVAAMLEAVGLLVALVPSAEQAMERVKSQAFHLVVLDWNLPGMTGLELCRMIRKDPAVANVPVLFLTANTSQKDLVEAFASGADDYVLKPFRAPELGARIFGLLRRSRMPRPLSAG